MKFLLSLLAVLIIGINGQKGGKGGGKAGKAGSEVVEVEDNEGLGPMQPLNRSIPFNQTDKTQYSRRQWMVIAISQFFDDFENGITENAPYIFARGCPYISNGAIYAGLDMSQPATWAVIPPKMRIDREFSSLNGTETWVRCVGVYPDGHQAIEFTAFTFDRQGLINTMSKLENKECPAPYPGQAPSAQTTASSTQMMSPSQSMTSQTMNRSQTNSSQTMTNPTATQTNAITTSSSTTLTPPVAKGLRADTKRVSDTTATVSVAPTISPTISSPTGKGKAGKGGKM